MEAHITPIELTCPEADIYNRLLELNGKEILELGCGKAELTRQIATGGAGRHITALEVDQIQHASNLAITDLPNVDFALAGAQDIPLDDASVDVVFMFKSLHHVPIPLMGQALEEIRRVLKPGGQAYISEPIYAGEFNEILRLFHDEGEVRAAAFRHVREAVENERFALQGQHFFNTPMKFDDFADFETKVIKVTHSHHELSPELHATVRERFSAHVGEDGAHFAMPIRVDLLQKPA